MLEKNPESVKIAFKNFPLRSHKQAKPAALAAIAAQKQGKFWEYHDQLFQNMKSLTPQKFLEIATNLGLDMEKFMKDMADPEVAKRVDLDTRQGAAVGVKGTPALYINGRKLKDRSVNGFQKIIDEELAKKGK
ncbi:MAG: thioredoxin domain-containing protein [Desulfobulbaceae bacterium]|nr:thioredoxin domain-containing protein [Desulfobulbaceae bacterium]